MSATSTVVQPTPSATTPRLVSWIKRRPVLAFYILAFALTWTSWLPLLLGQSGLGLLPFTASYDVFGTLGVIAGPWLSAMLTTAVVDGKPGVLGLLRRYGQWRVGARWWLFVLFPTVNWLAAGVLAGAVSPDGLIRQWPLIFSVYLRAAASILIVAQLWEEVGWRGFALPRLQACIHPLAAALVVGALQAVWHVPGFYFLGGFSPTEKPGLSLPLFVGFVLSIALLGVIMAWLYNGTRGSILMVILFHLSLNAGRRALIVIADPIAVERAAIVQSLALVVVALLIIFFTRGRLGYKRTHMIPPREAQCTDRSGVSS
jgi:uncharacterized protein